MTTLKLKVAVSMRLTLFCLCLLQAHVVCGQNEAAAAVIGATYEFKAPTAITRYNYPLGKLQRDTAVNGQTKIATLIGRTGNIFRLVNETETHYIIRFFAWKPTPGAPAAERNEQLVDSVSQPLSRPLFFAMPKAGFSSRVTRVYAKWARPEIAGGTVIIPVKMRSKPFDFTRDFSLGFSAGPRWRISRRQEHYFMLLGAFNVNIITVDSTSTGGKTLKSSDKGALGFALGGVFDFNGVQVGLFAGKDYLSHRDLVATNWIYNHKTWFAAGMGFTIFTRGNNSTNILTGAAVNKDRAPKGAKTGSGRSLPKP